MSSDYYLPEGFDSDLAEALEGGAGSNLGTLEMFCESVESVLEVGRVLSEGACPKLRYLFVGHKAAYSDLSVRGVKEFKTVLKGRGIRLLGHSGD